MFTILTRILFQDQLSKTGTEITYKIFSKKIEGKYHLVHLVILTKIRQDLENQLK